MHQHSLPHRLRRPQVPTGRGDSRRTSLLRLPRQANCFPRTLHSTRAYTHILTPTCLAGSAGCRVALASGSALAQMPEERDLQGASQPAHAQVAGAAAIGILLLPSKPESVADVSSGRAGGRLACAQGQFATFGEWTAKPAQAASHPWPCVASRVPRLCVTGSGEPAPLWALLLVSATPASCATSTVRWLVAQRSLPSNSSMKLKEPWLITPRPLTTPQA